MTVSAKRKRPPAADWSAVQKERVIVTRGKNRKPVLLTPIDESTETDIYFTNPDVLASIKQGIEDIKHKKVTTIKDLKNIWADIL